MKKLEGKVAVVTGASKGIGASIAKHLAAEGASVVVNYASSKKGADIVVEEITKAGGKAIAIGADVSKKADIVELFAQTKAAYGHVDILVNNAGIIDHADGPPSTASLEAIERTLRTNFFGPIAVTQALLPLLRKAPAARIVNVSSGLGSLTQNGDPNYFGAFAKFLGYNSSKAALNMLTVQLAYELRDTPIKVNSADPGYTATDLNDNRGTQTIAEGSAETIRLALLPDDGPSGTYSDSAGIVPW